MEDSKIPTTRRKFLGALGTVLVAAAARGGQASEPAKASALVPGKAGEMLVFNHEFTWQKNKPFFGWLPIAPILNRPGLCGIKTSKEEPPFEPFDSGQSSYPENWVEPNDYWNGTWQFRYQFKNRPSDRPGAIHMGIWSEMKDYWTTWKEMTSPKVPFHGKSGTFFSKEAESPASHWWRLKKDAPVEFSRVRDFTKLAFIMWTDRSKVLHPAKHLGDKSGWSEVQADYFPCTIRATVVAVPAGKSFSGWQGYPI